MENELIAEGRHRRAAAGRPAGLAAATNTVQRALREFELAGAEALADRSRPVALGILVRLALAGVLGLVAVMVAICVIACGSAAALVRRLAGLRAAALELAGERLPAVVARLRRGEEVDVAREAPPLEFGDDEIGQVGQAFNEVQRTAVASAVDEADAAARPQRGLPQHRPAQPDPAAPPAGPAGPDGAARPTDPDELEDLFRLDHLATRMRRHAEDLVILAGAAPGRGWRNPVPMVDVLRGAVVRGRGLRAGRPSRPMPSRPRSPAAPSATSSTCSPS